MSSHLTTGVKTESPGASAAHNPAAGRFSPGCNLYRKAPCISFKNRPWVIVILYCFAAKMLNCHSERSPDLSGQSEESHILIISPDASLRSA